MGYVGQLTLPSVDLTNNHANFTTEPLHIMSTTPNHPIKISSRSTGGPAGDEITFKGLTKEECEKLEGVQHGSLWVSIQNGRLECKWSYTQLPDPVDDPLMYPFWRAATADEAKADLQPELIPNPFPVSNIWSVPTIIINHLCGYYYTEDKYAAEAARLTEYGFIIMRSQRGLDGKYIEQWLLYGGWSAKGDLKDFIDALDRKMDAEEKTKKIIKFLCQHCSFGSLDIVTQRAAMTIE